MGGGSQGQEGVAKREATTALGAGLAEPGSRAAEEEDAAGKAVVAAADAGVRMVEDRVTRMADGPAGASSPLSFASQGKVRRMPKGE